MDRLMSFQRVCAPGRLVWGSGNVFATGRAGVCGGVESTVRVLHDPVAYGAGAGFPVILGAKIAESCPALPRKRGRVGSAWPAKRDGGHAGVAERVKRGSRVMVGAA